MQNFRALEAPPPDPRASGGWGLCPQTSSLRQLEAPPPDPHWPLAAGGSAPRPPKQLPHCEFLTTRLCVVSLLFNRLKFKKPSPLDGGTELTCTKMYHKTESGSKPPAFGRPNDFCKFSRKNIHFNAIWITFHTFLDLF